MAQYSYASVQYVHKETDMAFLLQINGENHWVPKSLIGDSSIIEEDDKDVEVEIQTWFLEQESIPYF